VCGARAEKSRSERSAAVAIITGLSKGTRSETTVAKMILEALISAGVISATMEGSVED